MTDKLDPRGVEAIARGLCLDSDGNEQNWQFFLEEARTLALRYLDATRPTGEADRIAVLVDCAGPVRCWPLLDTLLESDWRSLERDHRRANPGAGLFTRAIVKCPRLPRPSQPVEIEGSVE